MAPLQNIAGVLLAVAGIVAALPTPKPEPPPKPGVYEDSFVLETVGAPFSTSHSLLTAVGKFASFSKVTVDTDRDVCGAHCLAWGPLLALAPVVRYRPYAPCTSEEIPAARTNKVIVLSIEASSNCTAYEVGRLAQHKGYAGVILALPECASNGECNYEDFMKLNHERGDPHKATLDIPFAVYNEEDVRYMLMEQSKYASSTEHIYVSVLIADPDAYPSISQRLITMMMAAPLFMFVALCVARIVRTSLSRREVQRREGRSAARRAEQMDDILESIPAFEFKTLHQRNDAESLAEADMCSICLGQFEPDEQVRKLSCTCKYLYHKECIDSWLKESGACPVCKHSFVVMESESESESGLSDDTSSDESNDDASLLSFGGSRSSVIYEDEAETSSSSESDGTSLDNVPLVRSDS